LIELTEELIDRLIEAGRYAEEHKPENYMRIEAEYHSGLNDLERCAAPKIRVEFQLPTLEEIVRSTR